MGTVTLLTCLLTHVYARGFLRSLSILVSLIVGYVVALCMGLVDYSALQQADVVALPQWLPFTPELRLPIPMSSQ